MSGRVSSEWERQPDLFTLNVEVPFNTTAMVFVPGDEKSEVEESGLPLKQVEEIEYLGFKDGYHQLNVHSGRYSFSAKKD